MFNDEVSLDLADYTFLNAYFDKNYNWAGFQFYDKELNQYLIDTPLEQDDLDKVIMPNNKANL